MLRSPHLYGYSLLSLAIVALAIAWWQGRSAWQHDRVAWSSERAELSSQAATLSQRAAILDHHVDHLVGELQKNGVRIERIADGFRKTFGTPPSDPSEYGVTSIFDPADVSRLPKDRQPIFVPR